MLRLLAIPRALALVLLLLCVLGPGSCSSNASPSDDDPSLPITAQRKRTTSATSLEKAIRFARTLVTPPTSGPIHGSLKAQGEEGRLWLDIASQLARGGRADDALSALRPLELLDRPEEVVDSLLSPAMAGVRGTPEGADMLRRWRTQRRQWADSAFAAPYRDTLSTRDRIAGLALLWAEVRYSSAALPAIGLDWDSIFVANVSKALAPQSTLEYYGLLQAMTHRLSDGHTDVWYPPQLSHLHLASIPVTTRTITGRYYVDRVLSPSLETLGFRHGQEIVAVDGLAVDDYVASHIERWVFASTEQGRRHDRALFLFVGERDDTVRVSVVDSLGARRTLAVRRGTYSDQVRAHRPAAEVTWPRPGIAVARVRTFGADSVADVVERELQSGGPLRALVLDLRDNGGGSQDPGWRILSHFMREPVATREQYSRTYLATMRAWGHDPAWMRLPERIVKPAAKQWHVPVILLVGPGTGSAAEGVTAIFRQARIGTIMGEPTNGSTGQPLQIPLPGGGTARVRTEEERASDGSRYIGFGIKPDVTVEQSLAGFLAGRDDVLEAALRRLEGDPRPAP
jgi:C-terminal processing protease CtpA/Prc